MTKTALQLLLLIFTLCCTQVNADEVVSLCQKGKAAYTIVSPAKASECEKFAAEELKKSLSQIGKADFKITGKPSVKSIIVAARGSVKASGKVPDLSGEEYAVFMLDQTIYLMGATPRTTLFAVYDFLGQLGCRWVAPDFDFFGGTASSVPEKDNIDFIYRGLKREAPELKYRKLYVEEGKSHNLQNLLQLIDWMPRARFNTLVIPYNYQCSGKVKWDNWREQLTPELRKRGILIEVGGHGYQNLINAGMPCRGDRLVAPISNHTTPLVAPVPASTLFDEHPEWFGQDQIGRRVKDQRMVPCTSNPDAVNYLYRNLLSYLKSHREIDIFDFWPPDGEIWCQCPECKKLGDETERHILLVNQIARWLHKDLPQVKLECIAYSRYTAPPLISRLENKILLDFCPINQCFESQINENQSDRNRTYKENLLKWKETYGGDISIYSYYRKYAWHSLPNIIPNYMQNDIKYYQSIGVNGISVYSEPGDWFAYGVNHYVLAQLAWNPTAAVDALVKSYSEQIYGKAYPVVMGVYTEMEDIVRFACNIPFTTLKTPAQYDAYAKRISACRDKVKSAMVANKADQLTYSHLNRLDLMLDYAAKSISFMKFKSVGDKESMSKTEEDIKYFIKNHKEIGIVI